ncbi:FemAB family protein [Poriferisphaera corsica]|uniref:FemAB family protein n=1 Tax=Poriferisphaera corsica TaxID=2528020 RepID=A0A517YPU4_9BACT|nr:FemAB family XrtA/PEP-CTERM system-associated protein [Poriferisphaera corsica]QDU32249.1 FemAB family protein [Poriferisphaera corsica]
MLVHIEHDFDEKTCDQIAHYLRASKSPDVAIEHDVRWLRILRDGLGHRVMAIIARDRNDQIHGYLPLALTRSPLFGRFLVSLPYLNRAGIIADSTEIAHAIIQKAAEAAQWVNAQYLELRHLDQQLPSFSTSKSSPINQIKSDKVLMQLDLTSIQDNDALWQHYSAKVRNQIRKAEKHPLSIQWGSSHLLDAFYGIFAINMRDLGTPVYSKRLFERIIAELPDNAEFGIVSHENQPVAAALLLHDDLASSPRTQIPSASCLRAFNHTNANMFMYHNLLQRALSRGSHIFDFGRSTPDTGTFRFKKQWGATPTACHWHYHLRRGSINAVRPESASMQRKVELWKKMPVWMTKAIGPAIVKGIP